MAPLVPRLADFASAPLSRWAQFLLSTPVVWWAGWPFLARGARSLRTGHWNMFTLIALGVGAAWTYSAVAFLAPGIFPEAMRPQGRVEVYFEAAAVIVALVLLGQVLELRARSQTSSAIKALLNLAPATAIRGWLEGISNLTQVGRNGLHRYNNSDHSMLTAMRAVDNILLGTNHDIWAVNVESVYHEEQTENEEPYRVPPDTPAMEQPLASER